MTHTPGPYWFAKGPQTIDVGAGDYVLAEVQPIEDNNLGHGNHPGGTMEDNARLFTSAPDLLEALEASLQFTLAWIPEYRDRNDELAEAQLNRIHAQIDKARAAIARAKGES